MLICFGGLEAIGIIKAAPNQPAAKLTNKSERIIVKTGSILIIFNNNINYSVCKSLKVILDKLVLLYIIVLLMLIPTTITSKWQMTIPLAVRLALSLDKPGKVLLEVEKKQKKIKITKPVDFYDLAGSLKPKKIINAVAIRDYMEKHYERV